MKNSRSVVSTIREKHSKKDNEPSGMNGHENYNKSEYEKNIQYSSDRKTESEMKRSELHYKFLNNLFQTIPCAIAHFSCSRTPKMKYCNRAAIIFCGFEDSNEYEQLLGVGFNRFVPTEWAAYVNSLFTQVLDKSEPIEFEYPICKIDGSLAWLRGILQKSTSEDGEPILQSVYMDITSQKKMLRDINCETAQLQGLMDNMPAGVAIYEVTDRISGIYVNDGLCRLAGYEIEEYKELVAKDALLGVHPDDTDKIVTKLQRCMLENKQFDVNLRLIQKSHGFRWVNLKAKIIEQNEDKVVLYAVYTDVIRLNQSQQEFEENTEIIRPKESLSAVLEYAKKVAQVRQEFLLHISHEICTPLDAVIGMLDLLKQQENLAENEDLKNANVSARDLANVLHDILDVFKSA